MNVPFKPIDASSFIQDELVVEFIPSPFTLKDLLQPVGGGIYISQSHPQGNTQNSEKANMCSHCVSSREEYENVV